MSDPSPSLASAAAPASVPDWGVSLNSSAGRTGYYFNEPHDQQFVLAQTTFVVNLVYDETDIAVNSDRLWRLRTPRDCVVTVPAGSEVREISDGSSEALILSIQSARLRELQENIGAARYLPMRFAHDLVLPEAGSLARQLRRVFFSGAQRDTLYLDELILQLQYSIVCGYYRQSAEQGAAQPKLSMPALQRVHDFMHANLAGNVSLVALAEQASLSHYHFARAYRNSTGLSPHQALLELRIQHARRLLLNSARSLAEIAVSCGFCSQAHLTSTFRKRLDITPLQYRQNRLGQRRGGDA